MSVSGVLSGGPFVGSELQDIIHNTNARLIPMPETVAFTGIFLAPYIALPLNMPFLSFI
jgi:hypothetical protein